MEVVVKRHSVTLILVAMLCALCLAQDSPQKKVSPHRSQMKAVSADTLKWGPPGADWMQGTPPPEFWNQCGVNSRSFRETRRKRGLLSFASRVRTVRSYRRTGIPRTRT